MSVSTYMGRFTQEVAWRGRVACTVGYCNGTGEVSCLRLVGMLDAAGKKLIGRQ